MILWRNSLLYVIIHGIRSVWTWFWNAPFLVTFWTISSTRRLCPSGMWHQYQRFRGTCCLHLCGTRCGYTDSPETMVVHCRICDRTFRKTDLPLISRVINRGGTHLVGDFFAKVSNWAHGPDLCHGYRLQWIYVNRCCALHLLSAAWKTQPIICHSRFNTFDLSQHTRLTRSGDDWITCKQLIISSLYSARNNFFPVYVRST